MATIKRLREVFGRLRAKFPAARHAGLGVVRGASWGTAAIDPASDTVWFRAEDVAAMSDDELLLAVVDALGCLAGTRSNPSEEVLRARRTETLPSLPALPRPPPPRPNPRRRRSRR